MEHSKEDVTNQLLSAEFFLGEVRKYLERQAEA